MSKIKLMTHTDLDGIGCAILAYLAFGRENVDVEYCNYDDVDEKVVKFVENEELFESYDKVFITDISVIDGTALLVGLRDIPPRKVRLFDHHPTALGLNKYEWCHVNIDEDFGKIKTSGTSLFFKYLLCNKLFVNMSGDQDLNLCRFVEIVRDWDTFRWKELGKEGIVSKQVNDLFHIYGRDEFITYIINSIRSDDPYEFPMFYGTALALLEQKQKDIDIYIAEKNTQLQIATDRFGKTFGWVFAERYFSELGNRLCELHPEIEYVAMIDIGRGLVSFRSVKEDIDLGGEIAHSLGGGGHKKAAGSTFDAVEIGRSVSWRVLSYPINWPDVKKYCFAEPFEKKED